MAKSGDALPPLNLERSSPEELFQRYQKPVIAGVVVLGLAIGGGWMYKRSAEIKEVRAAEALALAEAQYTQGGAEGVQPELARVATRYAGTTAGAQAALVSAQLHLEIGQADSALARIGGALRKAPAHMRSGLLSLEAAAKVAQGDLAAGAAAYEAAASASQFSQERDALMITAARVRASAGDVAAAVAILEEIAAREDSPHAAEARLRLGEVRNKS